MNGWRRRNTWWSNSRAKEDKGILGIDSKEYGKDGM